MDFICFRPAPDTNQACNDDVLHLSSRGHNLGSSFCSQLFLGGFTTTEGTSLLIPPSFLASKGEAVLVLESCGSCEHPFLSFKLLRKYSVRFKNKNKTTHGPGVMAQCLVVCTDLPENLSLLSRTHLS